MLRSVRMGTRGSIGRDEARIFFLCWTNGWDSEQGVVPH